MYIFICTLMHALFIEIYARRRADKHKHIRAHTPTHTHTYIHTYIHTHPRTQTDTYTHRLSERMVALVVDDVT